MHPEFSAAFPAGFASDIKAVSPLLALPSNDFTVETFTQVCDCETIRIPSRVYMPAISERTFAAMPSIQRSIAACWFTRHHDGYIRERFLRALPAFNSTWIVGYVIALCGEYVIELLHYVWEQRTKFDTDVLGRWLRENPAYYSLTRRRIVSYWDCYHRVSFPKFENYVGRHLIEFFDGHIQCGR